MTEDSPYKIKYELFPEGDVFVARCLDFEVVSDGATEEEALENLREAIELFLERNAEALMQHAAAADLADAEDDFAAGG